MEENSSKVIQMSPKKETALNHQQLKQAYDQAMQNGKKLFEENQQMRAMLQQITMDQSLKQIEAVFACMDREKFFSKEFFKRAAKRVEEYLAPEETEEPKEDNKEK